MRRAYASGAVDFVVKPFDPDVLRSKVAVFVELFRKSREVAAAAAMRAWIERDRVETAAREAEYKRIDRMKDEFLATLAHELRTPLTSLVVARRFPGAAARAGRDGDRACTVSFAGSWRTCAAWSRTRWRSRASRRVRSRCGPRPSTCARSSGARSSSARRRSMRRAPIWS